MRYASIVLLSACVVVGLGAQGASPRTMTRADVDRLMQELSNWGRWGAEDERGTVNLITPATRRAAAALVTEGFSVSLARDADAETSVDNPSPFSHTMNPPAGGAFHTDGYSVFFHGFAHTHIDALSHVFHDGRMYNGFPASAVDETGASRLAVTEYRDGIFARGVLVDIPWLRGVPYLEPSTAIYAEDLDAWEARTGVRIGSGDVVFVRTGRWARRQAAGAWNISAASAGLHASTASWFRTRDIAMLGGDAASDVLPSGIPDVAFPLHQLLLVAMGTPMFDQCDLEAVAAAADARNRWTFLLTAAPLRLVGGTGAAINLTATF